jgi:hypothetical protein
MQRFKKNFYLPLMLLMLRHPLGKKTKYINQFWPKFILDKQGVNGTNSKFSDPRNLRSYVTIKFKNMFKILFK